jgi:anthranilate synthase component 1
LFESAEHGKSWSRYSFIGLGAVAVLTAEGSQGRWSGRTPVGVETQGEFLTLLRQSLALLHTEPDEVLPPFTGGLVGYLGFDVVRHVEHLPKKLDENRAVPDSVFWLVTDLAVLDHHDGHLTLISNAINFDGTDQGVDGAWSAACQRLTRMRAQLVGPRNSHSAKVTSPNSQTSAEVTRVTSSESYCQSVKSAQNHIRAGDAFQIVLSQRFEVPAPGDSFNIYRALRATNPSPYLYFLQVPDAKTPTQTGFAIAGSSPEALVTLSRGHLTMHPIAGTRPRGGDHEADKDIENELLADEKEKSEHLMLVDLGRNDLSRVSAPGTVEVSQFMKVERYSHVMHLVSTLEAQVADGVDAVSAVMATFPAGTLSGAPKVRAIEIIDELEPVGRGVYGGAVGYFDFAGNADMAIAIRTAVAFSDRVLVQAGAGVVVGSVPEKEDEECRAKAQVVIDAIHRARAGLN